MRLPGCAETRMPGALRGLIKPCRAWPGEQAVPGLAALSLPGGWTLAFQQVPGYTPPVWPWRTGAQGRIDAAAVL